MYMPTAGGFCSYFLAAFGKLMPADPLNYQIVNNTLHLFWLDSVNAPEGVQ